MKRAQVLAYRWSASGLGAEPPAGALLDLGVQDSPVGSAPLALAVRGLDDEGLATVWSFRGAPHRHRPAGLRSLAAALLPLSDADARSRLAALGPALRKAGLDAAEAIAETAAAVASVVAPGTAKGALSAGVTELVRPEYSAYCRGCDATHVNDQLLRLSALAGGARVENPSPMTFGPIPRWTVPVAPKGTERLLLAYLTLHGPATQPDAAGFLGTTGPNVRAVWPDGLAPVDVEGCPCVAPEPVLADVAEAPPARGVHLLPPSDPYLQMRDRTLFVPDERLRKALWPVLAWPGAVAVDGEVAGIWRAKQAGKGRLLLTVTAFGKVPRNGVEAAAEVVREVRGATSVEVTFAG